MCEEFKDFSVTHLLTGWAPQTVTIEASKQESIWEDILLPSLPLWVRDSEGNGQGPRKYLVLASFRLMKEQTQATEVNTDVSKLQEYGYILASVLSAVRDNSDCSQRSWNPSIHI